MRCLLIALCMVFSGSAIWAVEPDEILEDPALETRARDLSKELRCLVCRNESIDESNATLARDLRLLVRERLTAGDSDQAVLDYIVERYGEFVLLRPRLAGQNLILWLAGPAMLLGGLGMVFLVIRRRRDDRLAPVEALNAQEEARLKSLLDE